MVLWRSIPIYGHKKKGGGFKISQEITLKQALYGQELRCLAGNALCIFGACPIDRTDARCSRLPCWMRAHNKQLSSLGPTLIIVHLITEQWKTAQAKYSRRGFTEASLWLGISHGSCAFQNVSGTARRDGNQNADKQANFLCAWQMTPLALQSSGTEVNKSKLLAIASPFLLSLHQHVVARRGSLRWAGKRNAKEAPADHLLFTSYRAEDKANHIWFLSF